MTTENSNEINIGEIQQKQRQQSQDNALRPKISLTEVPNQHRKKNRFKVKKNFCFYVFFNYNKKTL